MTGHPDTSSAAAPGSPAPRKSVTAFRVAALSSRKATRFDLRPDQAARAGLAEALGLISLPALRMKGEITPQGARDFTLTARLEVEAVQPCSVTLAPVPAKLDEPVLRRFVADWQEPEGDEVEMPEDDSAEPLPEVIDLIDVAREALALALPLYPRAPGAELGEAVFAPPGAEPIREQELKPFAGLAALKDKLGGGSTEGGTGG